MRADLHTHSTASDGTDAPADLPRLAKQAGLEAFALTDHDTTAGHAPAAAAAKKLGITFVPGIELSIVADPFAEHSPLASDEPAPQPAGSVHLLGYHVRSDSEALTIIETKLRRGRETRNPQIIAKLAELGVRIDYQDVLKLAQAGSEDNPDEHAIGRPHIAQLLVQRNYVKSIHEAFARYLGHGAAAYIPRELPTADRAIAAIHKAGGVAVLAHPVHLRLSPDDLEHHLARLTDLGLDGIETQHPDHEPNDTKQLTALAEQFDLITTGGSDYHGSRKAIALGSVTAPDDTLDKLEQAAAQYA
ncbi:MAG: PHP domain-containing protein [Phycisphaeraceae bacterium]